MATQRVFDYTKISAVEHDTFNSLNRIYTGWIICTINELKEARARYANLAASYHRATVSARLSFYEVTEYIKIRCKLEGVEYGL